MVGIIHIMFNSEMLISLMVQIAIFKHNFKAIFHSIVKLSGFIEKYFVMMFVACTFVKFAIMAVLL